jgi:hypothetical protein
MLANVGGGSTIRPRWNVTTGLCAGLLGFATLRRAIPRPVRVHVVLLATSQARET